MGSLWVSSRFSSSNMTSGNKNLFCQGGCSNDIAEGSAVLLKMQIYPRYKTKGNDGSFQTSTFLIQQHMGSLREMF